MVRIRKALPLFHAGLILVLAPLARAEGDATAPVSCEEQLKKVDEKFKPVLSKDPKTECPNNLQAEVDKTMALPLTPADKASCTEDDASVCRGTYAHLKIAVGKYKAAFKEGCEKSASIGKSCVKSDSPAEQKAYLQCMAKDLRDAAAAEQKAQKAMKDAVEEARKYVKATSDASKKYTDDGTAIKNAQQRIIDSASWKEEADAQKDADLLTRATALRNNNLVTDQSLMDEIRAGNGGVPTLDRYSQITGSLSGEEDRANRFASDFVRSGNTEATDRANAAKALLARADETDRSVTNLRTAGSDTPTKSPTKSSSSSDITDMAKLATAGTGLAGAASKMASTGASSMPSGGSVDPGGPVYQPPVTTGGSRAPDPAHFGDNTPPPSTGGVKDPAAPTGPTDFGPGKVGGVIGTPGGIGGHGGISGNNFGLGTNAPPSATRLAASSGSSTAPSGGDSASLKDGRKLASKDDKDSACAGADCAAINDLKTTQFNATGAIGVPRIGAPDPALATTGALDNLFGDLPADPNAAKPAEPVKSGGGLLDGMLGGSFGPADGAGVAAAEQAAATGIEPASARSLFVRVHSVHETALRKGAVSLFHKRL